MWSIGCRLSITGLKAVGFHIGAARPWMPLPTSQSPMRQGCGFCVIGFRVQRCE